MVQNDSELEKQIKKCFTDTQMAHDEELELFDTDQTIKNISALFIAYKDKAVEAVLDRLEKECHSIAMFPDGTADYEVVPLSAIQAERNKLKEVR